MSDIDLNTIAENTSASNSKKAQALCNYFKVTSPQELFSDTVCMTIDKTGSVLELRLGFGLDTDITTVELCKAKLAEWNEQGTPMYVDYILATPVDIECTEAQNEILSNIEENARTYDKITYIYSTDNVSPKIEITYKKDIETLFANTLVESGV